MAFDLLDPEHPAEHNQAIMELGALICTPTDPKCYDCPVHVNCHAFEKKNWTEFPVKISAKPVKTRHLNYLIITNGKSILLQQRLEKDIWKGLFEFVLLETSSSVEDFRAFAQMEGFQMLTKYFGKNLTFAGCTEVSHKLTHRILKIKFWVLQVKSLPANLNSTFAVEIDKINHTFALPKPIEQFLAKYNFQEHVS
jgi:A/G-specific adenine glycosylase